MVEKIIFRNKAIVVITTKYTYTKPHVNIPLMLFDDIYSIYLHLYVMHMYTHISRFTALQNKCMSYCELPSGSESSH